MLYSDKVAYTSTHLHYPKFDFYSNFHFSTFLLYVNQFSPRSLHISLYPSLILNHPSYILTITHRSLHRFTPYITLSQPQSYHLYIHPSNPFSSPYHTPRHLRIHLYPLLYLHSDRLHICIYHIIHLPLHPNLSSRTQNNLLSLISHTLIHYGRG